MLRIQQLFRLSINGFFRAFGNIMREKAMYEVVKERCAQISAAAGTGNMRPMLLALEVIRLERAGDRFRDATEQRDHRQAELSARIVRLTRVRRRLRRLNDLLQAHTKLVEILFCPEFVERSGDSKPASRYYGRRVTQEVKVYDRLKARVEKLQGEERQLSITVDALERLVDEMAPVLRQLEEESTIATRTAARLRVGRVLDCMDEARTLVA